MIYAYPRLDHDRAVELLDEYSGVGVDLRERVATSNPRVQWYPTAAKRANDEMLRSLREGVLEVSGQCGFPSNVSPRSAALTEFDRRLGPFLHRSMNIIPADAAHEGVWSFLSLVLLPDVAFWRFPNRDRRDEYERILGRPRNVFRRLWWRSHILGSAPGTAAERLLEDEAVAILERPTLGGEPRIARAIATVHLDYATRGSSPGRTELLRQAMKVLRRLSSVISLSALDDQTLNDTVQEVFDSVQEVGSPRRARAASVGAGSRR